MLFPNKTVYWNGWQLAPLDNSPGHLLDGGLGLLTPVLLLGGLCQETNWAPDKPLLAFSGEEVGEPSDLLDVI